MNYYFTFNDSYSGVYHSQVIDVVKLYKSNGVDVKLIAFVSLQNFKSDKKEIKKYLPDAIVFPAVPKLKNWRINKFSLKYLVKSDSVVICRGVFATNIALLQKERFKKIIYDGRGAIKAEQEEYGVYNGTGVEKDILYLEKKAVLESDFRISVSSKLIEYWQKMYRYNSNNHYIIPCSLGDNFINEKIKKDYTLIPGLKEGDTLLIYSGSLAGWQTLDNLEEILTEFLKNEKIKVLFLSKEHEIIRILAKKYPNRIFRKWLSPINVTKYLILGDYGLLLRKDNWTNRVASPVKFAEYLSVGLKVFISEHIGDFSEIVEDNNLGYIFGKSELSISKIDIKEKEKIRNFAICNFSKSAVLNDYLKVIIS